MSEMMMMMVVVVVVVVIIVIIIMEGTQGPRMRLLHGLARRSSEQEGDMSEWSYVVQYYYHHLQGPRSYTTWIRQDVM
jgi:hypothetical protein